MNNKQPLFEDTKKGGGSITLLEALKQLKAKKNLDSYFQLQVIRVNNKDQVNLYKKELTAAT